jgi:gas vesicle protein
MLYAPKSGSETRDFLRSKSEKGAQYARQAASDAAELAKQKSDELKKIAVESIESGYQAVKGESGNS